MWKHLRLSFWHDRSNSNSSRNKSDILAEQLKGNVDVLVISKIKLDTSFEDNQFNIPDYTSPSGRDRNKCGGDLTVFVRKHILSNMLSREVSPRKGIYIELDHRKKKGFFAARIIPIEKTFQISRVCWGVT